MRHLLLSLSLIGCARSVALPPAESIVEGNVASDTISDRTSVLIEPARWTSHERGPAQAATFWEGIGALDLAAAGRAAHSIDERTFVLALESLMRSDPSDVLGQAPLHLDFLNGIFEIIRGRDP